MASSDLSPGYLSYHDQRKASAQSMTLSSNVDAESIYKPPHELKYPDGEIPVNRAESPASSSSSSSDSDLSSPSFNRDSEFELNRRDKLERQITKVERDDALSVENESDSNSTTTPKTIVSNNNQKSDTSSVESDRVNNNRKIRKVNCIKNL